MQDDQMIGQISAYSALPAVKCPNCGAKLHRVYNTPTQWEYICLDESLLVAPGTDDPPVKVMVK
jgi:hypothetical protein